jgi:hypothetical protein
MGISSEMPSLHLRACFNIHISPEERTLVTLGQNRRFNKNYENPPEISEKPACIAIIVLMFVAPAPRRKAECLNSKTRS